LDSPAVASAADPDHSGTKREIEDSENGKGTKKGKTARTEAPAPLSESDLKKETIVELYQKDGSVSVYAHLGRGAPWRDIQSGVRGEVLNDAEGDWICVKGDDWEGFIQLKNLRLTKPSTRSGGVEPSTEAELSMRDTIEWLVRLPQPIRQQMEEAENFLLTRSQPAPKVAHQGEATINTVLVTIQRDCVEAAQQLVQNGFCPALLNAAHGYNCGGVFDTGESREADIFRKTSLFLSLWPHRRKDDGPGVQQRGMWIGEYDEILPRKEAFYEHTECGGIYSPCVCILRDARSELHDASAISSLPSFGVITVAAQDVGFVPPFQKDLLFEKARTMLWIAADKKHDSIVLGTFGCGYCGNPPEVVADTFKKLLGPGGEFEHIFRVVVFAVTGGNVRPFAERFQMVSQISFIRETAPLLQE
jgi:hypothetical protein